MIELVPLALLGGILGLDVVCFPQMMVSRPLVAATLGGAMAGNATMGVLLGVTLELFALATLPFGASRYPEWGSASVVGGAITSAMPDATVGALTVGVLATLATAWIGGMSLVSLRQWNAWMARRRRPALDAGARGTVIGLQLAGLTADVVRASLLTVGAYLVLHPLAHALLGAWTLGESVSRGFVVSVACAVSFTAAWTIFHSARGARWYFAGGLGFGFLILVVR